jgi:hypothetical protein
MGMIIFMASTSTYGSPTKTRRFLKVTEPPYKNIGSAQRDRKLRPIEMTGAVLLRSPTSTRRGQQFYIKDRVAVMHANFGDQEALHSKNTARLLQSRRGTSAVGDININHASFASGRHWGSALDGKTGTISTISNKRVD